MMVIGVTTAIVFPIVAVTFFPPGIGPGKASAQNNFMQLHRDFEQQMQPMRDFAKLVSIAQFSGFILAFAGFLIAFTNWIVWFMRPEGPLPVVQAKEQSIGVDNKPPEVP